LILFMLWLASCVAHRRWPSPALGDSPGHALEMNQSLQRDLGGGNGAFFPHLLHKDVAATGGSLENEHETRVR
jgi:hypothetical protein